MLEKGNRPLPRDAVNPDEAIKDPQWLALKACTTRYSLPNTKPCCPKKI